MPTVKNRCLVYAQSMDDHTHIVPGVHLKVIERDIDLDNIPLDGGALIKTKVVSSDPYIRYRLSQTSVGMFCPTIQVGDNVDNFAIGKVIRSDDPAWKPGDVVTGYFDFADYCVYPGKKQHFFKMPLRKVDKHPELSYSTYLGPLGLPGHSAYGSYKAFMEEKVKTAETMFVSAGAGAVGAFLIQYIKNAAPHIKIIASAGSSEKVEYMKSIGVDVPLCYKTEDTAEVLRKHGPLDIYYDSVGGPILDAALMNMKTFGLIIACGCISSASDSNSIKNFEQVFSRSLTIRGFITYTGPIAPALATHDMDVIPLLLQGKISMREHRYYGADEAAQALRDVHTGANIGKSLVIFEDD